MRLDILRRAVLAEGGEWTGKRAALAVSRNGSHESEIPMPSVGRRLLAQLADEGLVVQSGEKPAVWTLTAEALRQQEGWRSQCGPTGWETVESP